MSDVAQQLLQQLIHDHGMAIVDEPRRLESLIKDYAQGQHKREVNLWLLALREGVVQELKTNRLPLDIMTARLANKLSDEHAIDLKAAQWTVGSWAFALNLVADDARVAPQSPPVTKQSAPTSAEKLSNLGSNKPIFDYPIQPSNRRTPPPRIGEKWLKVAEFHAGHVKTGLFSSEDTTLASFAWSPNGELIATAQGANGVCRLWKKSGEMQAQLNQGYFGRKSRDYYSCVVFQNQLHSPLLATAGHGKLAVWQPNNCYGDTNRPSKEFAIGPEKHFVCSMAWHPTQKHLIALSISVEDYPKDNLLMLWDTDMGQALWQRDEPFVSYQLEWSPCGRFLQVSHFLGESILLVDLQGQTIEIPALLSNMVPKRHAFSFHPSGRYFITQTKDDAYGIYDTEKLEAIAERTIGNCKQLMATGWSPAGSYLALAYQSHSPCLRYEYDNWIVGIYDIGQAITIHEIPFVSFKAHEYGWSPDGNRLLVHDFHYETLILVDPTSGQQLSTFTTRRLSVNNGPSYLWNPQGTSFAFADDKGVVTVMELNC